MTPLLLVLFVCVASVPADGSEGPLTWESFACPKGTDLKEETYHDGDIFVPGGRAKWCEKGGKKHGPFAEWHRPGTLSELGRYENGEEEGHWSYFHPSGAKKAVAQFERGGRVRWQAWYEGGALKSELRGFDHRSLHGFREDGSAIIEGERRCRLVDLSDPVAPMDPVEYCRNCGDWTCRDPKGRPMPCDKDLEVKGCEVTSTGARCAPCVVPTKLSCKAPSTLRTKTTNPEWDLGPLTTTWCEVGGVRNGPWIEWYSHDGKRVEGTFVKGKKDGIWRKWDFDGQLQSEEAHADGQRHGRSRLFSLGKKKSEGSFVKGQKHGRWTRFLDGQPSESGSYDRGKKSGEWTLWSTGTSMRDIPSGNKSVTQVYQDGKRHGPRIYWTKDGGKLEHTEYQSDLMHGSALRWHENGQPSMKGEYRFGQPCGDFGCWTEKGAPKSCYRVSDLWRAPNQACRPTPTGARCSACGLVTKPTESTSADSSLQHLLAGQEGREAQATYARQELICPPREARAESPQRTRTISRATIEDIMSKNCRGLVRNCYAHWLPEEGQSVEGRVMLWFRVHPDGTVLQAKIEDSTLKAMPVEACILESACSLSFPARTGEEPLDVRYPYVFESPGKLE